MGKGSLEVFGHQRRLDGRKFDGAFFEVDCFTKELTKNVNPHGTNSVGVYTVNGADERARTADLRITSASLCQLSYIGTEK